ncbi:MAG: arginine N-succinyltransferase, partial [Marinomonas sp.]
SAEGSHYLVSNTKVTDFRCILVQRATSPVEEIKLTQEEADALQIKTEEAVRVVELSPNTSR